jgi:hypothetical protein
MFHEISDVFNWSEQVVLAVQAEGAVNGICKWHLAAFGQFDTEPANNAGVLALSVVR